MTDENFDDLDFGDEGGTGTPPVEPANLGIPTQLFDGLAAHQTKAIEDAQKPYKATGIAEGPMTEMIRIPSAFGGPPLEISKDAFENGPVSAWINESINWQKAEDAAKAEQDEAAARELMGEVREPVDFSEDGDIDDESFAWLVNRALGRVHLTIGRKPSPEAKAAMHLLSRDD